MQISWRNRPARSQLILRIICLICTGFLFPLAYLVVSFQLLCLAGTATHTAWQISCP